MARAIPPDRIICILLYSVQYEPELDELLPGGDVVVVDPGTDHAAVFGRSGGREFA